MLFRSRGAATPAAAPPTVAVIVPCFNEEAGIGAVVRGVRATLPAARVYVIDNASQDLTAVTAAEAGATVITETARGKGNAVRRAFAEIDADVYVMLDGDGTYDVAAASAMIEKLVAHRLDMIVGVREPADAACYRPGHRFGNWLFNTVIRLLFKGRLEDV